MFNALFGVAPLAVVHIDQRPNSGKYYLVEVSGLNLESSQTCGFGIKMLETSIKPHKGEGRGVKSVRSDFCLNYVQEFSLRYWLEKYTKLHVVLWPEGVKVLTDGKTFSKLLVFSSNTSTFNGWVQTSVSLPL